MENHTNENNTKTLVGDGEKEKGNEAGRRSESQDLTTLTFLTIFCKAGQRGRNASRGRRRSQERGGPDYEIPDQNICGNQMRSEREKNMSFTKRYIFKNGSLDLETDDGMWKQTKRIKIQWTKGNKTDFVSDFFFLNT